LSSAETSVIFTAVFYPKDYSEQVVWPWIKKTKG
jgi:hypothetical protein